MMDARRNEVYLGAYSADGRQILQDRPRILDREQDVKKSSQSFEFTISCWRWRSYEVIFGPIKNHL